MLFQIAYFFSFIELSNTLLQITQREVDAVEDWLKDGASLHVMRDHPGHGNAMPILAGLWGMRLYSKNREKLKKILPAMLNFTSQSHGFYTDQIALQVKNKLVTLKIVNFF